MITLSSALNLLTEKSEVGSRVTNKLDKWLSHGLSNDGMGCDYVGYGKEWK